MTLVTYPLVLFALLLTLGYSPYSAFTRARAGLLTDKDISGLALTDHARLSHTSQYYTAAVIQELVEKGYCSPKRIYQPCKDYKAVFACKPMRAQKTNTWAVLIVGLSGWKPKIVTGYAMDESRLPAFATKNG